MTHPSPAVQAALIQLEDALVTWERNTGRESILVLKEPPDYEHWSLSGKPCPPLPVAIWKSICQPHFEKDKS